MIIWTCIYYKSPSRRRIDKSRQTANLQGGVGGGGGEKEAKEEEEEEREEEK